jgi:group I intron endonuclease
MIGFIYIIRNHINDNIYIGSTIKTIHTRFHQHVRDRLNHSNSLLYKSMAEYGHEIFYVTLLEEFEYENIQELRIHEGNYIQLLKPVLNKNIAGRSPKEYYKEYQEEIKKYQREYQKEYRKGSRQYQREYQKWYKRRKREINCDDYVNLDGGIITF